MDEKLIAHHMQTLGCTREEAIQLIQDDKDVDRGIAKPWDLTPEQMKNARKLANAHTRKVGTRKPKEKKENPTKRGFITAIESGLRQAGIDVTVSNPERTLEFTDAEGVSYTVTLTAHRK